MSFAGDRWRLLTRSYTHCETLGLHSEWRFRGYTNLPTESLLPYDQSPHVCHLHWQWGYARMRHKHPEVLVDWEGCIMIWRGQMGVHFGGTFHQFLLIVGLDYSPWAHYIWQAVITSHRRKTAFTWTCIIRIVIKDGNPSAALIDMYHSIIPLQSWNNSMKQGIECPRNSPCLSSSQN